MVRRIIQALPRGNVVEYRGSYVSEAPIDTKCELSITAVAEAFEKDIADELVSVYKGNEFLKDCWNPGALTVSIASAYVGDNYDHYWKTSEFDTFMFADISNRDIEALKHSRKMCYVPVEDEGGAVTIEYFECSVYYDNDDGKWSVALIVPYKTFDDVKYESRYPILLMTPNATKRVSARNRATEPLEGSIFMETSTGKTYILNRGEPYGTSQEWVEIGGAGLGE